MAPTGIAEIMGVKLPNPAPDGEKPPASPASPLQKRSAIREEIATLADEVLGRRRCPKCDGPMMHTRLKGYVCMGHC
ncbi:hypothetical protein B7486_63805 [cyanobacterium TDX16]|nr:hypothetical protein B7486_63805 [cyanobacterium TDX16]